MSSVKPNIAASYNPATGIWEPTGRRLARGFAGEQSMGFFFGERGYFIIEGPAGAAGHAANAPGFDGVAYHPGKKELVIYDNKAWKMKAGKASNTVGSASSLTTNLEKNLEALIKRIKSNKTMMQEMPHAQAIVRDLEKALKAVRAGNGSWPKNVKLAISNASGMRRGVSKGLKKLGIEFIDYYSLKGARKAWYKNPWAQKVLKDLRKETVRMEIAAGRKLSKEAEERLAKKVIKATAQHAKMFAQKRLPKIISEKILKMSAKKSAARAASLIPLVGWGFAANDAAKGVEDIMRGHVARGLAGIAMAGADVASDALHLGDAVSGVGGTALSIGAQVALGAGQVGLEIDRLQDKMKELEEEIGREGKLPPDERLRGYYEMEQEDIDKMKRELDEAAKESPIQEPDLPAEPEDLDLPPPSELPELPEPPPWQEEEDVPSFPVPADPRPQHRPQQQEKWDPKTTPIC